MNNIYLSENAGYRLSLSENAGYRLVLSNMDLTVIDSFLYDQNGNILKDQNGYPIMRQL